jgi:hypothetical protein
MGTLEATSTVAQESNNRDSKFSLKLISIRKRRIKEGFSNSSVKDN